MGRSRARKPNLGDLAEVLATMVLDEPAAPAIKSKRQVREVSALRAWHAVLASFLFFASSVANAETVQIIDDRGGPVIAYQMQWAMLAPRFGRRPRRIRRFDSPALPRFRRGDRALS
jgi:hypothetical protein